jgi:hypothetical protein
MEIAESKIWIMALFMLMSFLYKAYKKRNKAQKEAGDSFDSNSSEEEASWGINDLISQFEETYSGQKEVLVDQRAQKSPMETPIIDSAENVISENDKYEHSYRGNKEELEKKANRATKKKLENENAPEKLDLKLDLKQMIISQTILERPNF